jgi:hypothetical protein
MFHVPKSSFEDFLEGLIDGYSLGFCGFELVLLVKSWCCVFKMKLNRGTFHRVVPSLLFCKDFSRKVRGDDAPLYRQLTCGGLYRVNAMLPGTVMGIRGMNGDCVGGGGGGGGNVALGGVLGGDLGGEGGGVVPMCVGPFGPPVCPVGAPVPLGPADGPVVFGGLVLGGVVFGGDFWGDFWGGSSGTTGSPCCCR